jgi:hypothetical protein
VVADVLWALNSFPARVLLDALRGQATRLRDVAADAGANFRPRRATPRPTTGGFAVT